MYCCFTGHRTTQLAWKSNEDDERCIKLKAVLGELIDDAIISGYTDFYTGMALGIDTYAAELVLQKAKKNKGIMLHAVIPCPNQADLWCEKDKKRYNNILKKCKTKTIISPIYTKTCMLMRNQFMVDNSDRVISVWNGSFSGGTAYTVRYAKKLNRELYIIKPSEMSVTVH